MMSKPAASNTPVIYAVCAESVPVMIYAHQTEKDQYRIRLGRGIGWAPEVFKTRADVLAKLLGMKSYGIEEARMAKEACKQEI